jgi:hypothetical protein
MKYAKINQQNEVLVFPLSLQQLLDENLIESKNPTSSELAAVNVVEVTRVNSPAPDDEYVKELQAIRQPDSTWKETWIRLETSDEYKTAATVRKTQQVLMERNMRLANTDWIVTKSMESEEPMPQIWKTYRQALRDIPAQSGFPFNVQWPEPPNR